VITVASTSIGAEFDRSRAPWAIHLKERCRLQDPAIPSPGPSTDEALGLTGADLLLLGRVLVNWFVTATAVWAATVLVPGINVNGGVLTYLWVSLLFGLVNALLGPLLGLFVPDVTWPRLGLVALAVNGILLEVTSWLTVNLDIEGLVSSLLGALVVSVAVGLCEFTLRPFHPRGMSR
jgi:putative membrane protein